MTWELKFKDVKANKENYHLLAEWSKGELQSLRKELEIQGTSYTTRIKHLEAALPEKRHM